MIRTTKLMDWKKPITNVDKSQGTSRYSQGNKETDLSDTLRYTSNTELLSFLSLSFEPRAASDSILALCTCLPQSFYVNLPILDSVEYIFAAGRVFVIIAGLKRQKFI